MFVVGNFLLAAGKVLGIVLNVCFWLILVRALISWVNPDPFNPIVNFLNKATEPMLAPIRKIIPWRFRLGIDISPIIALLCIVFLQIFLVNTLIDLGLKLR
ncbi:MAG: YggT family protein [Candidatus Omnitrophota bacterium]